MRPIVKQKTCCPIEIAINNRVQLEGSSILSLLHAELCIAAARQGAFPQGASNASTMQISAWRKVRHCTTSFSTKGALQFNPSGDVLAAVF